MNGNSGRSRRAHALLDGGAQQRQPGVILAIVGALFCLAAMPAQLGTAGNEQAPEARPFGFRIGQERRYAIGPPDALEPGEGELWIMRLVSISGEPPNHRINFRLEHEATRFSRTANVFGRGELIVFRGFMNLTVNEYGFPLHIEYQGDFDNAPTSNSHEEVTLTYAEDWFDVRNRFSMRFREFRLSVASSPLVDPSIPRGVYVSGSENPALYSLILAGAGIEEVGDIEYMSLRPSPLATRSSGVRLNRPSRGGRLSRTRLRFEEFTTVDIGGIEEEAFRLRRPGGTRPDIYVRPDGTVLRVDMSTRLKRSAFIRLLRPMEY